jgi:EAL domain-containing protein (putative c-di-GMP-specific phosphodiesterase class I)
VPFLRDMPPLAGRLFETAPDHTDRTAESALDGNATVRTRGRVLVADDEPALLRSVMRLLRSKGYFAQAAGNGHEALSLFMSEPFDVVITDISMPGCDGIELLRQLHASNPEVPVILITGEPAVSTAVKALEYGAFHYLTKPVDLSTLEEVVDKATCLRRMAEMKRRALEFFGAHSPPDDLQALRATFRSAIDSLWMAFQPIVRADGTVFGYEALLRSDERSLPNPGAVIDAAERLGELDLLGRTIRARSAAAMVSAPADTVLFVNIHTTDLLDPELLSQDAPLSRIASRVVLEITERSSIDKVKDIRGVITQLRRIGFRIAVDDLGAGYAGLTSFALLEPEIVKLDMSLVRDVHESPTRQKLIQSMTALCRDMDMLVVGEGVETVEERATLQRLGCDLLQGYLIARPGRPFPTVSN